MSYLADREKLAPVLAGEVLFLGLLGKMIFTYPDPKTDTRKWFEFALSQELFDETPFAADQADVQAGMALLRKWTAENKLRPIEDVMLDLQADNTYLFACIGKITAPPWESVYFNKKRLTNQEQMLQVRTWYRKYGLVAERLYLESDDHIGLELLFVAHLASQALKAEEAGNDEKYTELVDAQANFLRKHLLLWGGIWCEQVLKFSKTDYYRGLALAIKGALAELGKVFEIEVS